MKQTFGIFLTLCFLGFSNKAHSSTYEIPKEIALSDIINTAEDGDQDAQYLIGSSVLFEEKILGEKYTNRKQALKWLDEAIKKEARLGKNIGVKLARNNRPVLAQQYFQKAVNAGYKDALYELAFLYLGPNHSNQSNLHAKRYLEAAALYGNSYAYVRIGHIYQNGWGIQRNFKKAEEYYLKAIKLGNTRGYSALAVMKEEHLPNPDYKEILDLFLKDAPYGHPTAITGIKRLYVKHKRETGIKQETVLFWHYVQRFHMVESLGYQVSILDKRTTFMDGLSSKKIEEIKSKAEALVKGFSD